jgi:hypothetical protein
MREAMFANETDRLWDFDGTKLGARRESMVQQMRYARWTFEIESCERRVMAETQCRENRYLPTNTKSLGTTHVSNQFATVNPHQTTVSN